MVRIIVDSATDLPETLKYEYNLNPVPTRVRFGDEIYKVGVDMDDNMFYELLPRSPYFPKTVNAPPRDFYRVFTQSNEETIYLSISRKLSKYYESALLAKTSFNLDHVTIYDTNSLSMVTGMMAITAVRMSRLGYSVSEILNVMDQMKERSVIYIAVPTLQYLFVSGRVNRAQMISGSLLRIKPILRVFNGVIESASRARGLPKAIASIPSLLENDFNRNEEIMLTVLHSNNLDGATDLARRLLDRFSVSEHFETRIGSSVGANIGPGAVGIAAVPAVKF